MSTIIKFVAIALTLTQVELLNSIERQKMLNWCWVASVQDVITQAGIYESQAQIAARLNGWPQDRPAYINEVVQLVKSYSLKAWQAGRPGTPIELYNTLVSGWKVIAFVRPLNGPVGHYVVLEGIDYYGNVIFSDPANGYTYPISPRQLYDRWRWSDSIVVGRQ